MEASSVADIPEDSKKRYLENRRNDLAICEAAFESCDLLIIEQHAHRMKGSGATFGFPEISELGDRLESAARAKNLEGIRQGLERFRACLGSVNSR